MLYVEGVNLLLIIMYWGINTFKWNVNYFNQTKKLFEGGKKIFSYLCFLSELEINHF